MTRRTLEICIDSFESARAAVEGGADQLEVCSSLALGGLTPSAGLLKRIVAAFPGVKTMCMLRPRGGDFVYDEEEMEVMLADMEVLAALGATGFVFGCLDEQNRLHVEQCGRLLAAAGARPCTLHRAFDLTAEWRTCLEQAVALGFSCILTSGCAPTAVQGKEVVAAAARLAAGRIGVMAGSGVAPASLPQLVGLVDAFHGSAGRDRESRASPSAFAMGSSDSDRVRVTDAAIVRKMRAIIDEL